MKKSVLIATLLVFVISSSFGQSYLGWTNKQVNFREGPGTDFNVIQSLKKGTQIFIISSETINDFYNVIFIESNIEGYIYKDFVDFGNEVEVNDQGIFTPSGETTSYNPDVEIFNNTDLTLTLKLGPTLFYFQPYEKRTLTLSPGNISYRASAPGVIPNLGSEYLKSNMDYTWEFFIRTTYR